MTLKFFLLVCLTGFIHCQEGKKITKLKVAEIQAPSHGTDLPFIPDFSIGRETKIVGGVDAYIENVPYQVSLRRLFQNDTFASWG